MQYEVKLCSRLYNFDIQPPQAAPVAIEILLHFLLSFLLEVYWLQT